MRKLKEKNIESYFVERLTAIGALVRKVSWIGRRGAPDRVVMVDGWTYWVELKTPGKVPDTHQERELGRLRNQGQTVFVADSIKSVDAFVTGVLTDLSINDDA